MMASLIQGLSVRNVDVILSTSPQLLCGVSGKILSKLKKIPHIFEVRDIWSESMVAVGMINKNGIIFKSVKKTRRKHN